MIPLFEQYRPKQWSEVIGQEKVLAKIEQLRRRGLAGRSFWITGASGTGKTSIGRLIAAEIADPFHIHELNAADLDTAALAEIEESLRYRGFGRGGKVWIVNEAHALNRRQIERLLTLLETLPDHAAFVFTTTNVGEKKLFDDYDDAGPLLSRCVRLELTNQGLARGFAERARAIAQAEGLDGKSVEAYIALVQKHRQNFRAVLNDIESGQMLQ